MTIQTLSARHRCAVYDYARSRRLHYQEQAYTLLGNQCAICGCKDELRLRFIDPNSPLVHKYSHSPATLYRRLCNEPNLRREVRLLCRLCRLEGKQQASAHQAINPFELSHIHEGINDN